MKKNKLVIDPHGRNHFKFMANSLEGWPDDEGEKLKKIESIYKDLELNGEIIFTGSKRGSYSIKCLKLNDKFYIIICLRNEFGTYNNTIYEFNNENDALAISKFAVKNIKSIMADYKKQILDAKKFYRKEEEQIEEREIGKDDNHEEN